MSRHSYHIIGIAVFAFLYLFLWKYCNIWTIVNSGVIQEHQAALLAFSQQHYYAAAASFVLIFTIHGAFALPATSAFIIIGGWLFGTGVGILLSLLSAIIGGSGCYIAARFLLGGTFQARYAEQLAHFNHKVSGSYAPYILTIRIIPIIPFFLANVLCGLAMVPAVTFMWTLIVGIFPSIVLYSMFGSTLGCIQSTQDLFNFKIPLLLTLIALLSIIPIAWQRYHSR